MNISPTGKDFRNYYQGLMKEKSVTSNKAEILQKVKHTLIAIQNKETIDSPITFDTKGPIAVSELSSTDIKVFKLFIKQFQKELNAQEKTELLETLQPGQKEWANVRLDILKNHGIKKIEVKEGVDQSGEIAITQIANKRLIALEKASKKKNIAKNKALFFKVSSAFFGIGSISAGFFGIILLTPPSTIAGGFAIAISALLASLSGISFNRAQAYKSESKQYGKELKEAEMKLQKAIKYQALYEDDEFKNSIKNNKNYKDLFKNGSIKNEDNFLKFHEEYVANKS